MYVSLTLRWDWNTKTAHDLDMPCLFTTLDLDAYAYKDGQRVWILCGHTPEGESPAAFFGSLAMQGIELEDIDSITFTNSEPTSNNLLDLPL